MADSAEPLLTRLAEEGVLSPDDLAELQASFPSASDETLDGEQLTGQLVGLSKLTPYQADSIRSGQVSNLLIGNYIVLDLLGKGGMGHVYKARHRDMDRIVALKVLPKERVNSKAGLRRFHQEVKAAARLVHPNIVTAFDADVSGGVPYLVMEFVEGKDLQAILAETGPLSFREAIDYVLQTARGLEYAHRVGVIHRDIKPANLLLDEHGIIRILDMGVAQLRQPVEDEASEPHQITRDGAVIGTTDFMSPEQSSSPRNTDARSDIYSLGCTLYFLLTNSPLYDDESAVDRIIAHRQRPAPRLREKRPDLPRDIDTLFAHMVAKEPGDRYQTVSHLIEDLELLRRNGRLGESPLSQVPTKPKQVKEKVETRKAPLLMFALISLLVMVLAFSAFYYYDNYMPGSGNVELQIGQRDAAVLVFDKFGRAVFDEKRAARQMTIDLPRGDYRVQVSKDGFVPTSRRVKLLPWQTERVSVQLEPLESLSGVDIENDLLPDPEPANPIDDSNSPPEEGTDQPLGRDQPDEFGAGGAEIFKGSH